MIPLSELRVPEPEQVREVLAMMLGRDVSVEDAGPTPPEGAIPVAVASLTDDADELIGCTWVDLGLGATIGAAITMVDATEAEACLTSGVLPPDFVTNVREVLGVARGLLAGNDADAPQLRELELLETGLAEDTLGLLADPRQGSFYRVDVPGYGNGLMSYVLV